MTKRMFPLILLYAMLIALLIISDASDDEIPETIPSLPELPQISSSSSGDPIESPLQVSYANITRTIVYPVRDGYFFNESGETIVVLVKITSLNKDGLENAEIWEIPGEGLRIENCSYPLRTSDLSEMLDYEVSDKSYITIDDINYTNVKKSFSDNMADPLYFYLYMLLNDSTKNHLNDSDVIQNDSIKVGLVEDFNRIINDSNICAFNTTHFIGSKAIYRSHRTEENNKNLYHGFSLNSDDYLGLNDYRLFKRRLLEDAFPSIRKISYYKTHEDHEISEYPKLIKITGIETGKNVLRDGESIVFKYYLHPEKVGMTNIRSIIRAKGFWHEEVTPINIIKRVPQF